MPPRPRSAPFHILVNNAGGPIKRQERQITWPIPTGWTTSTRRRWACFRITQALLPIMPTDGSGRIVNISGIAGASVLSSAMTHGLNNAAMNHVTKYLAKDLGPSRITVNSVIPGTHCHRVA
jgi:NAD(P)-dependent dehydrogenase (short-subunit alcohol dehydrogenase family)